MGLGLGQYIPWLVYLVVIGAAIASIWRPHLGVFALIPLLPNQTVRYKLHALPAGAQVVDLLLLCIATGILLRRGRLFSGTALRRPILAIWIITFISLWLGSVLHDLPLPLPGDVRFAEWKNYCRILFIVFLVIGSLRTRRDLAVAITLMAIGLGVVERGFILSNRGRSFSTFSYGLRDTGTMPIAGENGLAAFLAQSGLFFAGFAVSQPRWRNIAITAFSALAAVCLMLTFSRGAYLGFLAGFLVLVLLKRRMLLMWTISVILIVTTTGAALIPGAVFERISMTRGDEGELDTSAAARLVMWQLALDMFMSNPVLGSGFDTYRHLVNYNDLRDTHSYYLKVISETGVAGTLVYLWLLVSALRCSWRLFRDADNRDDPMLMSIGLGTLVCIVCVALVNIFGDRWAYLEITGFTCVMLGLVERGRQLVAEQDQAAEEDPVNGEPEWTDATA